MTCPKLDTCSLVKAVRDKGFEDPELYQACIEKVCDRCPEKVKE